MCRHHDPVLWSVEAVLLAVNPSAEARRILAQRAETSIEDDPFIHVELMLATELSTVYGAKGAQVEQILRDALTTYPLDKDRIDAAIAEVNKMMGNIIDDSTLIRIGQYIDELITKGATDATAAAPADDQPDETESEDDQPDETVGATPGLSKATLALIGGTAVMNILAGKGSVLGKFADVQDVFRGMTAAAKFSANNHFESVIMPILHKRIADIITSGSDDENTNGVSDLMDWMSGRLDDDAAYWRMSANAAASRAYHYGFARAGQILGASAYRVVAIIDDRTSEICQYLNGIEFNVDDIVNQANDIAAADPGDLPDISPWLSADEIIGASPEDLAAAGVCSPPYHPNCRSTLVLVYDNGD